MNKNDLNNILKSNVATITFTKADGTLRKMVCTTDYKALAAHSDTTNYIAPSGGRVSYIANRDDLLLVWDIEAEGWRTVTLADVKVLAHTPAEAYFAA